MNIVKKEINWQGRILSLETGRMAKQATGSVFARYGNTEVLATVVCSKKSNPEIDFLPLSVHYQEKYYAVGRFPGGFFKREGKPSEREVLISRLIDRPIRPIINEGITNEIQIIITVLSFDNENDTDILAMIAATSALELSGVPTEGIIGGAKVAYLDGNFIVNPKVEQLKNTKLELVVAGTKEGVLMVESEAHELLEEQMLEALDLGQKAYIEVIDLIEDFSKAANMPKMAVPVKNDELVKLEKQLKPLIEAKLKDAFKIVQKQERVAAIAKIEEEAKEELKKDFAEEVLSVFFSRYFKKVEKDIVRNLVLNDNIRIDGRKLDEIRKITTEVDVLAGPHGSSLFTRGETQALVVTTLGSDDDEQLVDDLKGSFKEKFILQYNFPPFSVGEVGKVGSPGRREVGHGKLAYRALNPMLPSTAEFPYSLRLVSEVLESNGSSSMATVCGGSLSLMAAGVPLARPVAGIAMGLIKEGSSFSVLSDILGDEDHLGDMDFKVAGTEKGITALQMDIKITSITRDIMVKALDQAKKGRFHILGKMAESLTEARVAVNSKAPIIKIIQIDTSKIAEVIGSGGKTIKNLIATYESKINVRDDGLIKISGFDIKKIDRIIEEIAGIVMEPKVGEVYKGKVVKILDFGAFVSLSPSKDGFLHISEITDNKNSNINDFLKVNTFVTVKVVKIDEQRKIRLSMKNVNQG